MKYEVTDAIMTQAIHAAIQKTGLLKLISTLDFELKAVKEENERLRERLDYYAKDHPFPNDGPWGVNSNDFGDVARADHKVENRVKKGGKKF